MGCLLAGVSDVGVYLCCYVLRFILVVNFGFGVCCKVSMLAVVGFMGC